MAAPAHSSGQTTERHPGGPVTRRQFLTLFAAVFLPMFMAAADQTLLATATPAVAASLGGLRDTSWIVVGYLLAGATIVPVYGRLGDAYGRRRMLLIALAVYAAGSAACAAAQTLPQLVAARVLQGLGGGGLMMLCHALIGELVAPVERVRFQVYFAGVFVVASTAGPVIGGLVVSHVSWRWLFVANLPLAAFAAWRLWRLPPGEKHPLPAGHADFAGHVLFALGAVSGLYWLTSVGHRFAWGSRESVLIGVTALIALTALFLHERRHHAPFLPVDLIANRAIRLSCALVLTFGACLFATIFLLPIYLQLGFRVSAALSGMLLLPLTTGQVIAATAASRILRRTGRPRPVLLGAMCLASAGLFLLGVLPSHFGLVILLGFVTGLGLGPIMPVNQLVVQTVAGRRRLGAVISLITLSRSTGGASGTALIAAIVFAMIPGADRQSLLLNASAYEAERVVAAFHYAFIVAAGVAALGAYAASRLPPLELWEAGGRNDQRARETG